MRTYSNLKYGDEKTIKTSLGLLINKETSVVEYRKAFYTLGMELGKVLSFTYKDIPASLTMLVCANEDADWLAMGVESGYNKGVLRKSVYWTTREVIYDNKEDLKVEITPIKKAFEEPIEKCELLLIVKSIISTSCVVKTQLTRLIGKIHPERIAILAPVIYKDGVPNLLKEFPEDISCKFHFIYFAMDDERINAEVIPGIGGMVYSRLGLGDINEKNSYIPKMVLKKL